MSTESGKALKEVSSSIKTMTSSPLSAAGSHLHDSRSAADDLKNILENSSLPTRAQLQEIMPVLVIASVLGDIINCVDKIALSVHELSRKARFKKSTCKAVEKQEQHQQVVLLHRGIVNPFDYNDGGGDHVVVEARRGGEDSPEKKNRVSSAA